jgi:cobalt-zinc-cadmium efflux system outer membrane protein
MGNKTSQNQKRSNRGSFFSKPNAFSCLLSAFAAAFIFAAAQINLAQNTAPFPAQTPVKLTSADYVSADGLSIDKLVELGTNRRADLLAARQRLAIAEGRLQQARLRPNPTLETEYGSPRLLGGEAESDFSVGVSQVFELGGKRSRRATVAELELNQIRSEVLQLEKQIIAQIRTNYTNALSAARQLDVLEKLIAANQEIVRVTEARLTEGDVAPLDVNLVKVEADRMRIQAIQTRSELETQILELKTLIGAEIAENLQLAPQTERPPRLDLGLSELTEMALNERPDLQAAKIGEQLGDARVNLAKANAVPNLEGSVRYSRKKEITDFPAQIGGNTINRDSELTFGVSIDIPIFNRNQGEIASAAGEKLQAVRQREYLEATIKRDVAVAYRKYRAASEQMVLYATQILPRSEENLRSIRSAYGFGEFSIFEVVNEQRRLTENVTGYNQALRDYYSALAELEAALGKTISESDFSTDSSSVLPDKNLIPSQTDRTRLLQTIENVEFSKKNVLSSNKNIKEIKKEQ